MAGFIVFIVIFSVLSIFCLYMAILTSKAQAKQKQASNKRIRELSAKSKIVANHTIGLPMPEDMSCSLYLCDDKIVIDGNNMTFNLNKQKLINVTIKSDIEIQKLYTSSAGGAVAGAIAFGALGALIGGRVKEKKVNTVKNYLIFTYDKEGNPEYIVFDVTTAPKCLEFVQDFKLMSNQVNRNINL